jgi:2-aminobenzoate-CoA ligase
VSRTAHVDTFVRDNLPPREWWPEFVFELPELRLPERMNCAAELLDRALERGWGERIAIRSPDGACTYAQLAAQVNRIANALVKDLGLAPGNRVLMRSGNNPMHVAAFLAVIRAGGIVVPTMPLLRTRELAEVVAKARISHALCDQRLAEAITAARAQFPMLKVVRSWYDDAPDSIDALAARHSEYFAAVDTAADDPAMIAFTSGTTGKPKGTIHFHRDLIAVTECFPRSCVKPSADDIFCGTPPIAFTYGLGALLLFPLRFGACTLLVEKYTPQTLLETIAKHRATTLFTAPTMYRQLAPIARGHDLASLKTCVSAGEALPDSTRQAFKQATGIEIIDGIGSSEMSYIFISHTVERVRRGATGYALPGYRATVLDEANRPCPPGKVGRLAVMGPTGCRYLADERQKNYVVTEGEMRGWNVTGDAYSMDAEGYFYYHARADDMIVSAGYNIAAPEVEAALMEHPGVAECAVVGWPDEDRGMIVKAYVVLRPEHTATEQMAAELQDHVKRSIAPYKYPRQVEFMGLLPRTETGKLQRYKLKKP